MTLGLDQVPELLFPAVACSGPVDVLAIVLVFTVGELAMSRLFFAVGLKGSSLLRRTTHKLVQGDLRPIIEAHRNDGGSRSH